jgi:calcium-dependent protein kinase
MPKLEDQDCVILTGRKMRDLTSAYSLGRELGRGQFGITNLGTNLSTGEEVAVKTISKGKLFNPSDIKDAQREVQIMHHLTGHDNIVGLVDTYEDHKAIHLVEELCAGGELFDAVVAQGHYTEQDASRSIRTILEVIKHCHELGVIHRDLKPENFLLSAKDNKTNIKATDFGLSTFYKEGDRFKELVGSAYYVAPEVLNKDYDEKADVWSAGVICFIMLSGSPPFWSYPETEQGIFAPS